MYGLCKVGRISSLALRAHHLQIQFCNPKATLHINKHCQKISSFRKQLGEYNILTNSSAQSLSFEHSSRNISTTAIRLAEHGGHDHSKIWSLERVLSFLLIPVLPAALISPCPQLDTASALLIVLHTHFGLEAIIVDYIRPILFGNVAPKVGIVLLYILSAVTFAGLLNLIYNDAGLANTILNIWRK